MKVFLVQFLDLNLKSQTKVFFFLSTQQLHLLESLIADTQILFYESQIKKLVRLQVLLLLQQ